MATCIVFFVNQPSAFRFSDEFATNDRMMFDGAVIDQPIVLDTNQLHRSWVGALRLSGVGGRACGGRVQLHLEWSRLPGILEDGCGLRWDRRQNRPDNTRRDVLRPDVLGLRVRRHAPGSTELEGHRGRDSSSHHERFRRQLWVRLQDGWPIPGLRESRWRRTRGLACRSAAPPGPMTAREKPRRSLHR